MFLKHEEITNKIGGNNTWLELGSMSTTEFSYLWLDENDEAFYREHFTLNWIFLFKDLWTIRASLVKIINSKLKHITSTCDKSILEFVLLSTDADVILWALKNPNLTYEILEKRHLDIKTLNIFLLLKFEGKLNHCMMSM